ncbi:polyamine-transporting ATPase 13A3 isoform X1 [Microplitis demolitor]|uniref:polyamine-transporting ATPase 13A3 isoform X1 n=1 Tax=Microplitis demolitor TaxID=69319 RepID=UPI00235B65A0|nr:polyamine-transporting ATPase 13A3 isoform X1 [Microplitis demolitor]
MPATPSKLNLSFARNAYNAFNNRTPTDNVDTQVEQKTELLEGTRGNGLSQLKNGVDYINPGEEDQMEIYGYRRNKIFTIITWLLIVATGGLLRLVFHWVPHLMVRATHSKCSLDEADTVLLIERFQGKHAYYYVKKLKTLTAADVSKNALDSETLIDESWNDAASVNSTDLAGVTTIDDTLKLSVHLHSGHFKRVSSILMFTCKKLVYIWDNERGEFLKLAGLDTGVSTSTLHQMPGLTSQEQFLRRSVYGNNEIKIPLKSFIHLLCLEALNPFYVFQLFSFGLWIADDYYYYGLAIMTMSGFGITMAVIQTRRNQQKLSSTVHSSDVATVMRDRTTGKTDSITSDRLVPGDILVIPPHGCVMPCDAVLLTGTCILNESMLTGESVPVTKTPVPSSADMIYDTKEHARHTLFCGTKVIQTRYFGGEKVLAVIIRTGFTTSKGGLVRSIMYPPPVDFKFEQDSYKFVEILACIAIVGAIYTVITKSMRGIPTRDIILEALDLITVVVPPALPAAMTVGRLVAQNRLEKKRIYCTSPRAINVSGSIDCICFDKTGTLTEDGLDMWGVVPATERKFFVPVKSISSLPAAELLFGMVSCHEITIIDGSLVGDPLDLKMFESTGWTLEEPDVSDNTKFSMMFPTIVRPPKNSRLLHTQEPLPGMSPARQNSIANSEVENMSLNNLAASDAELAEQGLEIGIIRQFPFTSSLQRMSVITRTLGATHYDLYCKGSPEMIQSLSRPESIPADFASVLQEYTSEGYRVIAMGHKPLNKLTYAKVQRLSRESAESDLHFLGFVILENRLKQETTPVIEELNRASIKTVMVTGDNILTALSVARDCEMIQSDMPVIAVTALQLGQQKPQLYYTRSDHTVSSPMPSSISEMTDLNSIISLETIESGSFVRTDGVYLSDDCHKHSTNKYVFAVDGKTWAIIKQYYPELLPRIATRGAIFARMSPDQKQQLVQELQGLGYYVAMVGDGANDCGALKAAHTGISLSDTESSVASPFTSRETNISCLQSVIREGRAALVTSFGIFKYMAAYSLTQFVSVMILYEIDSNLTDFEFLYIDLLIISVFAFFLPRTQAYDGPLVKDPPPTSLVSTSSILSIALQMILVTGFQCLSYWNLKQYDWYKQFNVEESEDKDDVSCLENYTLFIISSMQYIILAATFSKGHPYRKSVFTNHGLLASFILMSMFSSYLAICPFDWLAHQFELVLPPETSFRVRLVLYGAANLIIALFVECFIVDYLISGKLRYRWHNVDKSKRKFLAIERDMLKNTKWPPLTQEPPTPDVAVPDLIRRNTVTEIKIEKHIPDNASNHGGASIVTPVKSGIFFNKSSPRSLTMANKFGSAREVTLNPTSLVNDRRNTVSMQIVSPCYEDRELTDVTTPSRKLMNGNGDSHIKRRHNSESENGIDQHRTINHGNPLTSINPIATLPRNQSMQNQKIRDINMDKINKSEDLRRGQSVLEMDILPS